MFLSSSFGEVPRSPQVIAYKGRPVYAAIVSAVLVFPDPGGPADAVVSYLSSHSYSSSNVFPSPSDNRAKVQMLRLPKRTPNRKSPNSNSGDYSLETFRHDVGN